MLTLGEIEEGDDAGLFVVGGVFREDFIDASVIFFGEVEVGFGGVVRSVDVLKGRSRGTRVSLGVKCWTLDDKD